MLEFLQNNIVTMFSVAVVLETSLIGFMKLYVDEFQFSLIQTVSFRMIS